MLWSDELQAMIKHMVEQQTGGQRSVVYGHIATYDPKTQRARLVIPSYADGEGNYVLSGWTPLASGFAGANWGIQIAPEGGATVQNPTKGELCIVHLLDHANGVLAGASLVFNQVNTPPFPGLKAGEVALQSKAGSFVYMHANGDAEMNAQANALVTAKTDVDITATQGDANLTSTQGALNLMASQGEATITAQKIKFNNQQGMGFNGTDPVAKPTITGSKQHNAALASLLTALSVMGLVTDNTG